MKPNKKRNFISISILIILVFCVYLLFSYNKQKLKNPILSQIESKTETPQIEEKDKPESLFKKEGPTNENTKNISTTINVLDKNYSVKTEEGVNVYNVMKSAENDGFSFQGKEYPTLGFFVEGINGVKGEPGKYWIYYVNGEKAQVGISKYIVKDGDIINWKQE